ncbi:wax ester/triacylglycerol synthase family O-acyltransferase [Demequina sp. SYSU T00192]|uniref:diacylglycerol O-acyltransferase n=1 Tax=Demequina litoralis TaxID=3051660 RepID=A0ABT8G6I4_9MICO|nr:wax ester/triacylglycerol synthase domain-containing protein [Demequina sp. SYSU T00192]MDN4474534.1 wax ester/triacylglycerol synthase family O-acyltransferase [Demequina sp. SYSU T00192]
MRDPDRLTPADEANLTLDGVGVYVLTIVGLAGAGGFVRGPRDVDIDALRATLAGRVAGLPRLTRSVVGDAGRRRLVDRGLRIEDHVRAVEPVDGLDGLHRWCAALSTRRLPSDRPLWELLIVPGAHADGVAWVFRIHHALADGGAAVRLFDALFDPDPSAPGAPAPSPAAAVTAHRRHGPAWRQLGTVLRPMRRTALIGPSGTGRRLHVVDVDLPGVAGASHALGATVNDAVLAAIGDGARAALTVLEERIPDTLPVQVPVLLPGGAHRTNQVAAFTARVPLGDVGVAARARALAPATRAGASEVRDRALPWCVGTPAGARVMRRFVARQRVIAVLTTNVRGPDRPRRLCGAPVERVWALPVLAGTVRVGVAAVSYAGRLSVCVLWSEAIADAGAALARRFEDSLAAFAAPG